MTTQLRYRTLLSHLSKIFEAEHHERTSCLKNGLDEILSVINPMTPGEWQQVKKDSERLLKVWLGRSTGQGTYELMTEIVDALADNATPAGVIPAAGTPAGTPVLIITEKVEQPKTDPITHIPSYAMPPRSLPLSFPLKKAEEEEEAEEEDEEAEEEEEEVEEDEEVEEEEEEVEEDEEVEEEEEEVVVEKVEEAEEAVEEAEEAEEEEGLEVEKKIIRGRSYWMDVKTNDLYAITDDDEVGDQVGTIKDGKPVFLSTK